MTRYFACTTLLMLWLTFPATAEEKPRALFNGTDLSGWDGDPQFWSVEDGAIIGRLTADQPLKNNTFLIWKGEEPSDFRLQLEFQIEGGNSGVQYRSRVLDQEKWIVGGYQADIDAANQYTGILYEERGRGILAQRGQRVRINADGNSETVDFADPTELRKAIRDDDWNEYLIEAIGPRLRHIINGKLMSVTVDGDRKHRASSGVIALQLHQGPPMTVRFRNIRLEPVNPTPPPATQPPAEEQ